MNRVIDIKKSHIKAIELYEKGAPLNASTAINGTTSYGYGNLDDWGYWEFSLCFEKEEI